MTTFYLDWENGNDANDGTTFANRWKTIASGATAARIAPGDTIRMMASPDPTLVGSASWTSGSRSVTLASAVTATICACETAWTGSANVTATATSGSVKEGTNRASLAIAAAFTTGLAAYFATGTLDLSGYQQVSFWIQTNLAVAASTLSLRLCSDAAGVTTVNTVPIPAITATGTWTAITVDLGTALGSAIGSVALYADLDPGTVTILLDHIIACKASASADALTLTSLIGKVHNLAWAASSAYALGDNRRPTQPNRNGFSYRVTSAGTSGASEPAWPAEIGLSVADGSVVWICEELEDTWYPVASISGTTVKLDGAVATSAAATSNTYQGASETVATYRREALRLPAMPSAPTTGTYTTLQDSGTDGSWITFSGGWDRTAMSSQGGETWLTGQNGDGVGIACGSTSFVALANTGLTRFNSGVQSSSANTLLMLTNLQATGCGYGVSLTNGKRLLGTNLVCNNNANAGVDDSGLPSVLSCVTANGNGGGSPQLGLSYGALRTRMNYVVAKGNGAAGATNNGSSRADIEIRNLTTAANGTAGFSAGSYGNALLVNASLGEGTPIAVPATFLDEYVWSHKHGALAGVHLGTTDGGTIRSVSDVTHAGSGIAWRFNPTSTNRGAVYPLRLALAKLVCAANVTRSVTLWTRRDSTNIKGLLAIEGGQLPGVGQELSVACQPAVNSWEQSATLSFTPTEAGVVEIVFRVWDGVGTTASYWIDDLAVS